MRRTLPFVALLLAAPRIQAQVPPGRTLPKNATFKTGESPDAPSVLARKLRSDFEAANAAAQAALSRLKSQSVPKPLTQEQKLGLAAHAAGVERPCERTLFKVEGAAANFTIQPGQLILLNGCFKGAGSAEVRIAGNFPQGYLLLQIQERTDTFIYGRVPDVTGVPDQPVAVSIRFLSDGSTTTPKNGFFYAKRQTWDTYVDTDICRSLRVNDRMPIVDVNADGPICRAESKPGPGGVDRWSSRARDQGYRLTKFWWTAQTDEVPTSVHGTDDGSMDVAFPPKTWYGAHRMKVEGPAGIRPF